MFSDTEFFRCRICLILNGSDTDLFRYRNLPIPNFPIPIAPRPKLSDNDFSQTRMCSDSEICRYRILRYRFFRYRLSDTVPDSVTVSVSASASVHYFSFLIPRPFSIPPPLPPLCKSILIKIIGGLSAVRLFMFEFGLRPTFESSSSF